MTFFVVPQNVFTVAKWACSQKSSKVGRHLTSQNKHASFRFGHWRFTTYLIVDLNLVKSTHPIKLTLSSVLLVSRAADWVTIVTEGLQCLAMIAFVHRHEPHSPTITLEYCKAFDARQGQTGCYSQEVRTGKRTGGKWACYNKHQGFVCASNVTKW